MEAKGDAAWQPRRARPQGLAGAAGLCGPDHQRRARRGARRCAGDSPLADVPAVDRRGALWQVTHEPGGERLPMVKSPAELQSRVEFVGAADFAHPARHPLRPGAGDAGRRYDGSKPGPQGAALVRHHRPGDRAGHGNAGVHPRTQLARATKAPDPFASAPWEEGRDQQPAPSPAIHSARLRRMRASGGPGGGGTNVCPVIVS